MPELSQPIGSRADRAPFARSASENASRYPADIRCALRLRPHARPAACQHISRRRAAEIFQASTGVGLAPNVWDSVRGWACFAVVEADLDVADVLARMRLFAGEALRSRGVWAAHIPALKSDPGRATPVLKPLRADPSRYVQDSVANWINDAAKSKPDWARPVCPLGRREPAPSHGADRETRSAIPLKDQQTGCAHVRERDGRARRRVRLESRTVVTGPGG